MIRLISICLCVFIAGRLSSAPIPAGKSTTVPAEIPIPNRAVMVLQATDYPEMLKKFKTTMTETMGKEGEKYYDEWTKEKGSPLSLKGLGSERAYFAVLDFDFDDDSFVASVPVSDAKAFRASMDVQSTERLPDGTDLVTLNSGQSIHWREIKDRVVISKSKDVIDEMVKPFDAYKTRQMGECAEAFFAGDAGFYLNLDALRERFGEQVRQLKGLTPLILQQGAGQMDKKQLAQAKMAIELFLQIFEDGDGIVLSVALKKEGTAVNFHGTFQQNTPSAKFTSQEKPDSIAELGKLPANFGIYWASNYSSKFTEAMKGLYSEYSAAEGDEAGQKKIDEWFDLAKKTERSAAAINFDRMGLQMLKNPDAEKTVTAMVAAMKAVADNAEYQNIPIKGKPTVKDNDQTFRDVKLTKIEFGFDYEALANKQPAGAGDIAVESAKKMLPEKMIMWVGGKGDMIVNVSAKTWDEAKKILDQAFDNKDTLDTFSPAKATRSAMPTNVGSIIMLDVKQLLTFAESYSSSLKAIPGAAEELEKFKLVKVEGDTAIIGLTTTMKGHSVSAEVFVPNRAGAIIYQATKALRNEQ